jgi:hypothetical protein
VSTSPKGGSQSPVIDAINAVRAAVAGCLRNSVRIVPRELPRRVEFRERVHGGGAGEIQPMLRELRRCSSDTGIDRQPRQHVHGPETASDTRAGEDQVGVGDGDTSGEGEGDKSGEGDGDTSGEGDGDKSGEGDGDMAGEGDGDTSGDGDGDTSGEGDGETSGNGDTSGEGDGETSGNGDTSGEGDGDREERESGEGLGLLRYGIVFDRGVGTGPGGVIPSEGELDPDGDIEGDADGVAFAPPPGKMPP